jgi:hypothetical protein
MDEINRSHTFGTKDMVCESGIEDTAIDESEFIKKLSPNITVDVDEYGKIQFWKNEHRLVITRDEITICICLVTEFQSMADMCKV